MNPYLWRSRHVGNGMRCVRVYVCVCTPTVCCCWWEWMITTWSRASLTSWRLWACVWAPFLIPVDGKFCFLVFCIHPSSICPFIHHLSNAVPKISRVLFRHGDTTFLEFMLLWEGQIIANNPTNMKLQVVNSCFERRGRQV